MKKLKDSVTREMKEFAIAFYQHYADGHKQPVTVDDFSMPSMWPPEFVIDDSTISFDEAKTLKKNSYIEASRDGNSWYPCFFSGLGCTANVPDGRFFVVYKDGSCSYTSDRHETEYVKFIRWPEGERMQAKLVPIEEGEVYVKKTTLPIQYQVEEKIDKCFYCKFKPPKSDKGFPAPPIECEFCSHNHESNFQPKDLASPFEEKP